MSVYTKNLSDYVRKKEINISKMARDTGISYSALYSSLMDSDRERNLRDYEFMSMPGKSEMALNRHFLYFF